MLSGMNSILTYLPTNCEIWLTGSDFSDQEAWSLRISYPLHCKYPIFDLTGYSNSSGQRLRPLQTNSNVFYMVKPNFGCSEIMC